MPCHALTKAGKPCRKQTNYDICDMHSQMGEGLYEDVKGVAKKVINFSPFTRRIAAVAQGPRKTATARFNRFMEETSGRKVVKVELGRKPIVPLVQRAMDALSLGRFSKKQKELDYDAVYHQFLIVTLDDGRKIKIEKNEIVEQKPAKESDYKNKVWDIPLQGKDLTIKDMVANASAGQEQAFWQYSGSKDNCQKFSRDIIERNGLMPHNEKEFATQDAKALTDSLPAATHAIPNLVTGIAATADRLYHGDGLQKRLKKIKYACPL